MSFRSAEANLQTPEEDPENSPSRKKQIWILPYAERVTIIPDRFQFRERADF